MHTCTCPACQHQFSAADELVHQSWNCPECGRSFPNVVTASFLSMSDKSDPFTTRGVPGMAMPSEAKVDAYSAHARLGSTDNGGAGTVSDLADMLAPPQHESELGRLGKYRILSVLGRGGMGVVLHGEDPTLEREVAIKVMLPEVAAKPDMKERFLREARSAASLEHDHIVPIYQVDEQGNTPFIVMPLLKGQTLDDWLRQRREANGGRIPVARILELAQEITLGLAAAHQRGLIHRDIKPKNIWLDESAGDRVRLLDFGLAREISLGAEDRLTQSGVLLGTPAYMAPEQARGGRKALDARADLFSLGVVLYQLCTGELPFDAPDPMSVLIALAMQDPPPPQSRNLEIPQPLSELVMHLLEKDPERRPPTAKAVLETIESLQASQDGTLSGSPAPIFAPKTAVPEKHPPRKRWRTGALIALGFLGLAITLGGVYYLQTSEGTVRIEVNDPEIEIKLDKEGTWIKGASKEPIRLKPGAHGVMVKRGDFEFETKDFILRRGKEVILRIDFLPGKVQVRQGDTVLDTRELPAKSRFVPLPVGWLARVGELGAKARCEAVEEELRKRNPEVDPIYLEDPEIMAGHIVRLVLGKVQDLTPLAAFPQLQELRIDDPTALDDLTPLRGLKLTRLDLGNTDLDTGLSRVGDLAPLVGMPLSFLTFRSEKVTDLSPLASLPLETLRLWRVPMGTNFEVLGEIKTLRGFHILFSDLKDLRPLRSLRLTALSVTHAPLEDLSPITAMPLGYLDVCATKLTSLAPLKGMQLSHLNISSNSLSQEDLAVVATLPLTTLHAQESNLRKLDFLKDMRITMVNISNTAVEDLSPLRGLPLEELWIQQSAVKDLSPLKGMKLKRLWYEGPRIKDVSVLIDLPLESVWCDFTPERDGVLRRNKTLESINDMPVMQFWRQNTLKKR